VTALRPLQQKLPSALSVLFLEVKGLCFRLR
jgi:hypothetical protein